MTAVLPSTETLAELNESILDDVPVDEVRLTEDTSSEIETAAELPTDGWAWISERYAEATSFMHRIIYSQTGGNQSTEDIVQEAIIKIGNSNSPFDEKLSSVKGYYTLVAKRAVIEYWRKEEHRSSIQTAFADMSIIQSPELVEEDFQDKVTLDIVSSQNLEKMLSSLSEAQRKVIQLTIEGRTQHEIAELLGLPLGTVKTHRNRGYNSLRVYLSKSKSEPEEAGKAVSA